LAIDARAKASGRSVAQEAEHLLETALDPAGPWNAAFGGKRVRAVALSMLTAFQAAGSRAAGDRFEGDAWVLDRACYKAAMWGVIQALLIGISEKLTPDLDPEETAQEIDALKSALLTRILNSRQKMG